MERTFLEGLGLSKENVEAILVENSKDVEAEKKIATDYKEQLDKVEEKLKNFGNVDVTELQNQIKTLTGDLETERTAHARELENLRFDSFLDEKIRAHGPKDGKLVRALLDVEKLRTSKNQEADIQTAISAVKKDYDYLFPTGKPAPRVVAGTSTTQTDGTDRKAQANEALRALIGKEN